MNSQGSAGFPERWTKEYVRRERRRRLLRNAWWVRHAPGGAVTCFSRAFAELTKSSPTSRMINLVFTCRCKSLAELKSKRPRPLDIQTLASTAAEISGAEPELAPDPAVAHTQA